MRSYKILILIEIVEDDCEIDITRKTAIGNNIYYRDESNYFSKTYSFFISDT